MDQRTMENDQNSTESAEAEEAAVVGIDETGRERRLTILRSFVRQTKVRNLQQQQQYKQPEAPSTAIGLVPLFTEFLKIDYTKKDGGVRLLDGKGAADVMESTAYQADNDEPHNNKSKVAPRRLIIDVDVELGLKPRSATRVCASKADSVTVQPPTMTTRRDTAARANPSSAASLTPYEEGYYEGSVSLAMADDSLYLNEIHCWVRRNLELFSATSQDIAHSNNAAGAAGASGRRSSVVIGKIGIRCIHCAAAAAVAAQCTRVGKTNSTNSKFPTTPSTQSGRFVWPTAGQSYPLNVNGLYSACTQKPHLHFNHCPYLPPNEKAHLKILTHDTSDRPTKRLRGGIPAATYYMVAVKRIGLIEIDDGMRFGRDLSLNPLPLETILARVQEKQEISSPTGTISEGFVDEPEWSDSESIVASSSPPPPMISRLLGDEASEQVLAEAVAEPDDPSKFLARSADKSLVSDFVFLTIKQMAICNAMPSDYGTRGKKTRSMRVGLAGFCCRHCGNGPSSRSSSSDSNRRQTRMSTADYSCRSFCSLPDNLSSAISTSFSNHLAKCPNVPLRIKKAMTAYRRIHQRQMSQLPYGSQRRLCHEMWTRLRAADKSESEMQEVLSTLKPPPLVAAVPDEAGCLRPTAMKVSSTPTRTTDAPYTTASPREKVERGDEFPISGNVDTIAILQKYTDNWDPKSNDLLIVPEDRSLVSDYVFLTMRQLKVAFPTVSNGVRGRRGMPSHSSIPGVCCVHCAGQPNAEVIPSGRSFPSAPDNFASALNSSMYNHMQVCPFLPDDLKRALADVRKLHSAQCASIKFGSQRRYFNRLYDRLTRIPAPAEGEHRQPDEQQYGDYLKESGFLQLPTLEAGTLFLCRRCNMVPLQFRCSGSFYNQRPTPAQAQDHQARCAGDKLDLTLAVQTFRAAAVSVNQDPIKLISSETFQSVMRHVLGGVNELFDAIQKGILTILEGGTDAQSCTNQADLWRSLSSARINAVDMQKAFCELTSGLGYESCKIHEYPEMAAFLLVLGPSLETGEGARTESPASGVTAGTTSTTRSASSYNGVGGGVGTVGRTAVGSSESFNPDVHYLSSSEDT